MQAQTAVLIGLHLSAWDDRTGVTHAPSYRTFLLTFHEGNVQLAADNPDLIVPRKDGFWRVGILHKGNPVVAVTRNLSTPAKFSLPRAIGEYHPDDPDTRRFQTDRATIEFVNPELVSVSYMHDLGWTLESENHHASYKLDDITTPFDITAVLGVNAWSAQKKADVVAKANASRELGGCIGVSEPNPMNWGIKRSNRVENNWNVPWVIARNTAPHERR